MISLYTATIPAFRQIVAATQGVVAKGEAFAAERGIEPATLVEARLAPDMLPFGYQVKSLRDHSVGAIEGVRRGHFSPIRDGIPTDFAGMHAVLAEASATLAALDPAEIDGFVGRDMAFLIGDRRIDYAAEDFLLSFSLPNFYFHASIAYGLLRAAGVPIGKRDWIGRPRFRAAGTA